MMGQNEYCLAKVWVGMPADSNMHFDHRGNENNSNKRTGDVLESTTTWGDGGGCNIGGSKPPNKAKSNNPSI